jgi:uncharacterized protein (DUF934 family)
MAIIKNRQIAEDQWRHAVDEEALPREGKVTISLQRWQNEGSDLADRRQPLGVRIAAADAVEDLAAALPKFALLVLEMTHFADGRVFSQARLLRERYGYQGELRVRGDFLRDQLFFLSRVGVDAFEFPEGTDLETVLSAFDDFSVRYQAATDCTEPLYRRGR